MLCSALLCGALRCCVCCVCCAVLYGAVRYGTVPYRTAGWSQPRKTRQARGKPNAVAGPSRAAARRPPETRRREPRRGTPRGPACESAAARASATSGRRRMPRRGGRGPRRDDFRAVRAGRRSVFRVRGDPTTTTTTTRALAAHRHCAVVWLSLSGRRGSARACLAAPPGRQQRACGVAWRGPSSTRARRRPRPSAVRSCALTARGASRPPAPSPQRSATGPRFCSGATAGCAAAS